MKILKKQKFIIVLMVALLIVGTFVGCGKNSGNSNDKKTFIVGFDAEFPPYGYKDKNGEYVGFDLDLAEEVCKRNGWKLVKQPINWDTKDSELNSGMIDCIWNGFTIDGREDSYTWSKAYIDNSQVAVVKKGSGINKLSDLKGKIVAVQRDSSAYKAFKGENATEENKALAKSFKELEQVGDYNSAFLNLDSGTVKAVCLDIGVANAQVKSRGDNFVILDEQISTELYGIGFKLGNTELRDEVQKALDEMLEDGTFMRIAEKWELSEFVCLGREGTDSAYLLDADGTKRVAKKDPILKQMKYIISELGKGIGETVLIFSLTLLFAMPLGLIICSLRKSRSKILSGLIKMYISIVRGTPLMLQLLVVFFGPYYVFKIETSTSYRFYAVIIGFSLNYAAYFAEIYRAGFESIPVGQYEAANIMGYGKAQTFWKIIFPQMARRVIPPVTNEIITLIKDTSLAFSIEYIEMYTIAKQVAASTASIVPLFVAGIFYYVFNFIVAFVMERVENKMSYFQ